METMEKIEAPALKSHTVALLLKRYNDVQDAKARLKKLEDQLVTSTAAPCKVGDVITITGDAHTGKRMKITEVQLRVGRNNWRDCYTVSWSAKGNVLRATGEPGMATAIEKWEVNIGEGES